MVSHLLFASSAIAVLRTLHTLIIQLLRYKPALSGQKYLPLYYQSVLVILSMPI